MRIVLARALPAPPSAAWQTFVDLERWPRWSPWTVRFDGEPRFALGAQFRIAVPAPVMPWIELSFPCQVTALERLARIRWDGRIFGIPGYHQFAFEPSVGGCRVISEELLEGSRARLLGLARQVIVRRVERFLEQFAVAVVTGRGTAATRRGRP